VCVAPIRLSFSIKEKWKVMARKPDPEQERLDDAARAGWLYYIAGNTQEEIAQKLGVSRQTAQRLVSLAMTERLIKVRFDHPLGRCLELSNTLKNVFGLETCEVVPADPTSKSETLGIVEAAASEMERYLVSQHPVIMGLGTGRTLRAVAEEISPMECPQHKIVSLVGNIGPDGSATVFDVASRVGDRVGAPHFPMPFPVVASTVHERNLLIGQKSLRNVMDLAAQADVSFVGVGTVDETSAMLRDGFVRADELRAMVKAGAVGEILGWSFDVEGQLINGLVNDRVLSARLATAPARKMIGVVMAPARFRALKGALAGKLVNGLITNETMAEQLLRK
jgi:DNA-binding transcriptional regulator LsrR (DeoR family)